MSIPADSKTPEEQFFPTAAAQIQRWFPWVRLLRGFRMAIGVRRMTIALIAIFCWSAVESVLSPSTPEMASSLPATFSPWESSSGTTVVVRGEPEGETLSLAMTPQNRWWGPAQTLLWPLTRTLQPVGELLASPTLGQQFRAAIKLLCGLCISMILGGAICRMAAVDFAAHEDTSIRQGLAFSLKHSLSMLGAPLIACSALLACWLINFCTGLFSNIPVIGPTLVGVLWIVPMFFGFLMTIILIGLVLGWPLMVAGICVEARDAFDGFSRACSYVFNRPLYLLLLTAAMVIYGSFLLFFVERVVEFSTRLAVSSVSSGRFESEPVRRQLTSESQYDLLERLTTFRSRDVDVSGVAQAGKAFWMRVIAEIPRAFVFSYFWTMVTIIYFLLRKREDATPLNEVWRPIPPPGPDLPVVGIPGAELRERQEEQK